MQEQLPSDSVADICRFDVSGYANPTYVLKFLANQVTLWQKFNRGNH